MLLLASAFAPTVFAADQHFSPEQAIATEQLDQSRGGTDTTTNNTTITNTNDVNGNVSNNSATNVVSGNNSIDGGAFTGANGFPMVIQNSGSNVLIQNSTIITLELK